MTSTVTVSRRGADRVKALHHWVYRIDVVSVDAAAGDVVRVVDERGRPLGRAFYSAASQIALRFLTFQDQQVDTRFFRRRLEAAIDWRRRAVTDTTALRLVHGEGDFLSSLIVDRYGDVLVMQTLSQGTERLKQTWVDLLTELCQPVAIVERNEAAVRDLEGLPRHSGLLTGTLADDLEVVEHGLRYLVDPLAGQKTGAFLDQRENRMAAAAYARGRGLDVFAYHGSFALHLARHCDTVVAVDVSAEALERAARNAGLNGLRDRISTVEANAFDFLRAADQAAENFDIIVLDPPAFVKRRSALEAGTRGYKEINLRALRMLEPGGVLVTSTCSYHVSEEMFLGIVQSAAADAGTCVRVVEKRTQSRDHPIALAVPESYYLKCLVLEVMA
jgi:23S rRNA (cytosine1962-C5)-methyltransferase